MKANFFINPFQINPNTDYKVKRMKEEFSILGISSDVFKNDGSLGFTDDFGNIKLKVASDFAVYFDKDKYLANMLEKCGVRVFNRAAANELCDDKMMTHIALSGAGIPMPKTLAGALCFSRSLKVGKEYSEKIADELGFPLVAKLCYGSLGEQVYRIESFSELCRWIEENKTSASLFQQFEECGGSDIRVIAVGGKAIAAMKRTAVNGEFRSNIELGAKAENFLPNPEIIGLVEKAACVLGLDFCGVDILLTKNGPKLCEVNSNAMFTAIENTAKVNVAKAYCEHIVSETAKEKQ